MCVETAWPSMIHTCLGSGVFWGFCLFVWFWFLWGFFWFGLFLGGVVVLGGFLCGFWGFFGGEVGLF